MKRIQFPTEPTDDKHEQRIEAGPTWVLLAATAAIGVMILGLLIIGWSALR